MASVSAFNQTLQEFLKELSEVFPEDKRIKEQITSFELDNVTDSRVALEVVMPEMAKHANLITKRDEQVFVLLKPAFPEIDFVELWNSNISDNTKKVIWDYLNTLLMLGTTIMTIPTNMLSEIEKIAQTCVSQMQESQTQPDQVFVEAQKAIFNNGMLQNMMGQLNMGDMGALSNNAMATPTHTPRAPKTKKKGKKK